MSAVRNVRPGGGQGEVTRKVKTLIAQKAGALESTLEGLESLTRGGRGSRTGELMNYLTDQLSHLKSIYDDMDEPFSLFIVGTGKVGKSTLLNALIGERKAQVDVLPKTWKIDIYRKSGRPGVVIRQREGGGAVTRMGEEEARGMLEKEERKMDRSHKEAKKLLNKMQGEYSHDREALKELKKEIQLKHQYVSPVTEVVWPCQGSPLLEDFQLVDTPGLEQELLAEDLRMTLQNYYHKADGVIWLLDANRVSLDTPLFRQGDTLYGEPARGNIIAVVNRMDTATRGDPLVADRILQEARGIYGSRVRHILPLSAKMALEGIEKNDRGLLEGSGYVQLVRTIQEVFLASSQKIKAGSKLKGLQGYCRETGEVFGQFREEFDREQRQYRKVGREFHRSLGNTRENLQQQLIEGITRYQEKVKLNIGTRGEELFDMKDQARAQDFIRREILLQQELESLAGEISRSGRRDFQRQYEFWSKKALLSRHRHIRPLEGWDARPGSCLPEAPRDINISLEDLDLGGTVMGAGIIASLVGISILGPVGIAAGLIMGYTGLLKKISLDYKLPQVQAKLRAGLDGLQGDLQEKFQAQWDGMAGRIRETVEQAREKSFQDLYFPPGEVSRFQELARGLKDFDKLAGS